MLIRRCSAVTALALVLAMLSPRPARAWDETGHMVIARIAWSQLSPQVRAQIIALLAQAPDDAGLAQLRPSPADSAGDEIFMERASTWADIIRGRDPEPRHAYHRPTWHYHDWFWSEGPDGTIVESTTLHADSANILTELDRQSRIVRDTSATAADRAVALAWVLHLAGDIHQPLHASGRVTADEPDGDKGGNTFTLEAKMSLHWYWDRILTARYPRQPGESEGAYIDRVAGIVMTAVPRDSVASLITITSFDAWGRESLALAQHEVYCCGIQRGAAAPESYLEHAAAVSEQRIAVAGYRLAALLGTLFRP
jgi:hypothetical protein